MRQGRNFRAGHLLDASGERTIFSMTEILSLSLLYGCNENMSIKNKKEVLKIVGTSTKMKLGQIYALQLLRSKGGI